MGLMGYIPGWGKTVSRSELDLPDFPDADALVEHLIKRKQRGNQPRRMGSSSKRFGGLCLLLGALIAGTLNLMPYNPINSVPKEDNYHSPGIRMDYNLPGRDELGLQRETIV